MHFGQLIVLPKCNNNVIYIIRIFCRPNFIYQKYIFCDFKSFIFILFVHDPAEENLFSDQHF